jgi:hypothetical protein
MPPYLHAAVLGLPVVKRRFRDAVLARQIRRLRPGLVLLQHPDDLIFREPCSLHLSVLQEGRTLNPVEENLSGRSTRAVPRVRAGARLENRPSQDAAVRQTLGERIAAVRRFDYGPNAFVQRRETSVQSSLRESSSRNSVGVRKSQTVHPSAHRPPGRLRRSLSAFRPLRRPRWTG